MQKLIFFLVVIVLFSSIVNAVDLQKTEIYVNENGVLDFIEDYVISEDLSITLPEDYYDFNINLDSYELNENVLVFDVDEEISFEMKYSTSKFSYKTENMWRLFVSKEDLVNVENNFISVYLPKNAKLLSANEGAEIYTLGGRIIIDLKDVESLEISYELSKKRASSYLWIIYLVVLVLILFILGKMFVKRKHKGRSHEEVTEKQEDIMNTLTENETKIVKL